MLLGLMGVELAYVAGINGHKDIRLATAGAILVSGLLFMGVLAPRKMRFPEEEDLREVILGNRISSYTVLEQLIGVIDSQNSAIVQYRDESARRGWWFVRGLIVFIVTQALLAFIIGGS